MVLGYPLTNGGDPFATLGVLSRYYIWPGGLGQVMESDVFFQNGSGGSPAINEDGNVIGMVIFPRAATLSSGEQIRGTTVVLTSDEILAVLQSLENGGKFD